MSVVVAVATSALVNYRALSAGLKAVGLMAGGTRPMFPHIALAVGEAGLTVTGAAGADASVEVSLPAVVDGPAVRVLVSWAELAKVLPAAVKGLAKRALDQLDVAVVVSEDLEVSVGVGGYQLPITAAPDAVLPEIPVTTPGTHIVDRGEFAGMFDRVAAAAGSDQLLAVFTYVQTRLEETSVTMLATDRYRISRGSVPANGTADQTILLPGALTSKVLGLCDGPQLTIGIDDYAGHRWTTLHSGSVVVKLRDPQLDFPGVAHLFDLVNSDTATVDRAQLTAAADRAKAITAVLGETHEPARIVIAPGAITIAPGTHQRNAAAPQIPAETCVGDTWTGGINPSYLANGLTGFTDDTVTVAFTTPGKPIKITGADTFEHVIMLMRLA